MKEVFERINVILKLLAERAVPACKRVWAAYGYYISLACLLLLFGTAAYLYRTDDHSEYEPIQPPANSAIAVLAQSVSTPEPTPAPTPYSPAFIAPANGEIIAEYSPDDLTWNETLGQWRVHSGVDISASAGSAVYASESGVVSGSYKDDLFGNTIEITHDDGWVTRYCSLETLNLVSIGMSVEKGDIISSVGSSALIESSSGPHLHFEIIKNGEYVLPEYE